MRAEMPPVQLIRSTPFPSIHLLLSFVSVYLPPLPGPSCLFPHLPLILLIVVLLPFL